MAAVDYTKLYFSTDDIISKFKPSLSNYFDVHIRTSSDGWGGVKNDEIHFLAYDAVLPGTSFETTQVYGDRQGVTQTYANKRVYPPVDVSFYVDADYKVIHFFEKWMGAISPNLGGDGTGEKSSYVKFKYPHDNNLKTEVTITKFEKEIRDSSQRLMKAGSLKDFNNIKYVLINAYPTNIISLPVSYEQSGLLRTTITFNYDLYRYERKSDGKTDGTSFDGGQTVTKDANPGGDRITNLNANVGVTGEYIGSATQSQYIRQIESTYSGFPDRYIP